MLVQHEKFEVATNGKGTYEITNAVQDKIDKSDVRNGIVMIFVQHTSCSLTAMENAAPGARRDVERFFEKLVPEDADYEHDDEGLTTCPRTFGCCETTIINRNASRARQSFSYDRHHNAPAMGGPAMLKQVNTLPGPKLQPPFDNGDNLAGASQGHFDV